MSARSESVAELCVAIAVALHTHGAPVHRTEDAIDRVREAYGHPGATVASPTALWLQVGSAARIVRLGAADLDLGRLVATLRFVDRVEARPRDPAVLLDGLARHLARPEAWPDGLHRVAYVTSSAAAGVLLGGTVVDVVAAGVAGGLTLAIGQLLEPRREWRPLRNVLLAFVLGLLGSLCGLIGASPAIVVLAGAILILPGLSLTTALAELGEGHFSSGSARIMQVSLVLAELATGASLAWWAVGSLPVLLAPIPLPTEIVRTLPLLAPATFAILLKARPRDVPVVWLTAILGWVASTMFDGVTGAAFGGLAVGLLAAPLARLAQVPDLVLILPGILQLVPGSIGVRGVEQLLQRNVTTGLDTGLLALETAGAIAAGVLAGQAISRPVRTSAATTATVTATAPECSEVAVSPSLGPAATHSPNRPS